MEIFNQNKPVGKITQSEFLGDHTLQTRILVKKESIIQKELLGTVLRVMSFTIEPRALGAYF